jgi:hypothetical protein
MQADTEILDSYCDNQLIMQSHYSGSSAGRARSSHEDYRSLKGAHHARFDVIRCRIVVGLAVQTTVAQNDSSGVLINHVAGVPSARRGGVLHQKMGFREAFRNSDAQGNPTAIYIQVSKGTFIEGSRERAAPAGINHFGMEAPDIQKAVAFFKAHGAMATEPGAPSVLACETGERHRPEWFRIGFAGSVPSPSSEKRWRAGNRNKLSATETPKHETA